MVNNSTCIKLKTTDQELAVVHQPVLASGDVGTTRVEYELDSFWDGYALTGTFYASRLPSEVYEQPLTAGACVIPWEVLQDPDILYIGLRGVNGDGLVKTAAPVRYRIIKGSPCGTDTPREPTPDVYQQLLAKTYAVESMIEESAIVCESSGETVTIADASDQPLRGLKLYGKSVQNGTPTPENPVEIESVGDGGNVRISLTMDISKTGIKTTLPGIPVSSGGNYTDANGQQWLCDEMDFARGVKVQRVGKVDMSTLGWMYSGGILLARVFNMRENSKVLCSKYKAAGSVYDFLNYPPSILAYYSNWADCVNVKDTTYTDAETFKASMSGVMMYYELATPVETPISETDLTEHTENIIVYGKSTQNGTPTPNNPVPIVNSLQDIAHLYADISTPNGLPGLPVSSGGNYTDANGQQWICDEMDFARGVYVQRVGKVDLGTLGWYAHNTVTSLFEAILPKKSSVNYGDTSAIALSDKYEKEIWNIVESRDKQFGILNEFVRIYDVAYTNAATFKAAMSGAMLYYELATPVETPISETNLTAYRTLHTNKPNTTVYTDSDAGITVAYAADTKTYIDNKFAELATAVLQNA